ncbi:MAG TPA: TonB-dependent receptor [Blastocatellia bacterium]|nr:TonB-dependent receptor [Blastocatellia bacterium]
MTKAKQLSLPHSPGGNMFRRFFAHTLAVLATILVLTSSALPQTVTGTLSGTVTDATGAVIPNAQVTAKNLETSFSRTVTTNGEGFYNMPFLPLGNYDVTVAANGFQKIIKQAVAVELNKNTISNFKLEVAGSAAEVTITGETPQIETTTGEIKHSIGDKQIEDTPLAGRNFISLVEQIPGFQNAAWIGSANNPTNSTGSYAAFNGLGSRSTSFQIDGVNNDDSSENQNRQNVNISTIREVQIITNAFSAEFGRGGAAILVQTKSGTNRFHGEGYDFIQNDIFNANGYFRNRAGRSSTTGEPLQPRETVRRNQYGWTLGGPFWFPKPVFGPLSFDGRDKLFFFISGERVSNKTSGTATRFTWLPGEEPRACAPGEVAKPGGPYCVDPATHPNLQRDLAFMRKVFDLWKTPELNGVAPNDPTACADMIASGRPNRCVTLGISGVFPDSDYSGRLDYRATEKDNFTLRYQYSRSIRRSGRIIFGDNFGTNNNRQYNLGFTATHIFSNQQVGEFRYGFGNRATLQDVADGNDIPVIRFASTLCTGSNTGACGTIIGTSTNVPINRRQHDHQFVYNHTSTFARQTFKMGVDHRSQLLDDVTGDRARGFWTFSTLDSLASINARTGFTGWENFLRGFVTGYQKGFGDPYAQNRIGETNLYFEDKIKLARNLTIIPGVRYEYVRAPREIKNRFEYGVQDDKNNVEPRFGFALALGGGALRWLTGEAGDFSIRGGYGINHSRIFQSVYSQNQLSIRTQPPNGFAAAFDGQCRNEISDPSCGFNFTPGVSSRSTAFTANSANNTGAVRDIGGRLLSTLLLPDKNLGMPYVQQWNLTIERRLLNSWALHVGYNGNRGIGSPFFDSENDAIFPFTSPSLLVDVGSGNFRPVVFDRACTNLTDPICVVRNAQGQVDLTASGPLRAFSALNSTTATLAQKGIVIENGVPHGYVSISQPRTNERRPDANFIRNVSLQNFGWSYYHALITKLSRRYGNGFSLNASYTFSKAIDTGSEATFTGIDSNSPASKKGGAAASMRGVSSYHAAQRAVFSYSYLLPFFRSQKGIVGSLFGGWNLTGVSTFQSGNPFTVTIGYDINADGLTGERPRLADLSLLGKSIDDGRQLAGSTNPNDTGSQVQLPGSAFIPTNAGTINAADRLYLPGSANDATIGRNTFYSQGLNYTDMTASKIFRLRENVRLTMRMEFYNLFNRVTFNVPSARTILSSTPLGRITGERNIAGYVNSGRGSTSARTGQFALKLQF